MLNIASIERGGVAEPSYVLILPDNASARDDEPGTAASVTLAAVNERCLAVLWRAR